VLIFYVLLWRSWLSTRVCDPSLLVASLKFEILLRAVSNLMVPGSATAALVQ
jgi:hypothetical protein